MKSIFNLFIFLLLTQLSICQSKTEKSSLEYNVVTMKSEYFPDQKRTIKIYLPDSYDSSKKYPVIYTLDGNTLFDLTSKYVAQLSKLTVDDEGYDYASDVIPQSIVVGVFHNNRFSETTPNISQLSDSDETIYTEGSEKLKQFVFNEIIPYVDSKYSTSGYNSIIGHSNTAHFVMCLPFQINNPFKGIISLSLGGYSDRFESKLTSYLKTNQSENIFIGFGSKDFEFNELAKHIQSKVENDFLKVSEFNANHNEMPAIALIQGLKFLFKHYRNLNDFDTKSKEKDFKIEQYLEYFQLKNNKAYGIDTKIKEDDYYSLIQMSINSKNKNALNQLLEYETKKNGNPQQTHMLFVYNKQIEDFAKAEYLANKLLNSTDNLDNRILKANLQLYYDLFINDLNDAKKAIAFFKKGKNKFNDNKIEFSYFLAKACLEQNVEERLGKKNLSYCLNHFKKNRYFRKKDLEDLKNTITSNKIKS